MTERFYRPDGTPDVEFEKRYAERQQQIALERIQHRRERARAYLKNNPDQAQKNRERARAAVDRKRRSDPVLRRKLEIYEHLVELQGGEFCAICKATSNDSGKRFAIDHDWETDEIRGLLCRRCNNAIGNTRRQGGEWLQSALSYLERPMYTGIKYEEVRHVNRVEYAGLNGPRSENEGRL